MVFFSIKVGPPPYALKILKKHLYNKVFKLYIYNTETKTTCIQMTRLAMESHTLLESSIWTWWSNFTTRLDTSITRSTWYKIVAFCSHSSSCWMSLRWMPYLCRNLLFNNTTLVLIFINEIFISLVPFDYNNELSFLWFI